MKALIALAAIAVAVIALRPRRPAPLPESDDSEVVGMPTTWAAEQGNAMTLGPVSPWDRPVDAPAYWSGPGWWVEFAPTSRN